MSTAPATGPLRVALIGYGPAGSYFHAPLIAATPGLVLDTVVTGNDERREQVRAAYPGVRLAAGPGELWARADDLDLVVVASPNRTHVPLATAALEAGLPVVVDKPLAGTAEAARTLAKLAESRGLLLSVFQNRRWDSDFLTLQALLAHGGPDHGGDPGDPEDPDVPGGLGDPDDPDGSESGLGTVHRFESRFERWRPHLKGGWRESGDPEDVGGLLYDLGSHLVDQALTLFGPARLVYAECDVRRPGAAADDDTFIALTHTGGVRSHLWMSATTARLGPRFRVLGSAGGFTVHGLDPQEGALRAGLRPDGSAGPDASAGADGDTTGRAAGTRAEAEGSGTQGAGTGGAGWGAVPAEQWGTVGTDATPGGAAGIRPVPSLPGDYPAYYAAVARALRDGGPPPVTALEAAAALDVIEAARLSARTGQAVTL